MTYIVVAASSLLAVLLVIALAREVRLRRALQKLLSRIFQVWRNRNAHDSPARSHDVKSANRGSLDRDRSSSPTGVRFKKRSGSSNWAGIPRPAS